MSDIETIKIVCAVSIFLVGFIGVAIPLVQKERRDRQPIAYCKSPLILDEQKPHDDAKCSRTELQGSSHAAAESFAAGVVLSAGTVHVLGDACDSFDLVSPSFQYPIAIFVCASVILLLVTIQYALEAYLKKKKKKGTDGSMQGVWVFFGALGVHSVFEGLAIGGENDLTAISTVVAAILAHKGFAAFALGIRMADVYGLGSKGQLWILALLFSLASPLGCFIGMAVSASLRDSRSGLIAQGCLLAAAAGSFLFIATFEMIPHALKYGRLSWNLGLLWLGFGIFSVLAFWV
eukprot:ANDGO_02771.mRNA.1 Protein zntC